jgi:N-acetylglucosaminyl-diphospho-decaprenol L-rhamnosyltransferase
VDDQQALDAPGRGDAVAPPSIDLSIVTVSYNVRDYVAACLASLDAGADGLRTEVFVVDNASADGSADLVETRFPRVRVLRNGENVGFARAMNRGLALARGRWLLLLDPDTVVPPGALAALVAAAERWPEVGVAAAALDDPATREPQASFRPFLTWRDAFARHTVAKPFLRRGNTPRWQPVHDRPTDVGFLIGACLLVRREVLETVGALDEGYFLFCEDMEYCRRVVRAGWKLLYTEDARIGHHEGKSAEQEAPAWMRMVTLASVLRYLGGEPARHPVVLRRLFKAGYLAQVAVQAGESAVKTVAYGLVGARAASDKHRRRLARSVRFLAYAGRVARL